MCDCECDCAEGRAQRLDRMMVRRLVERGVLVLDEVSNPYVLPAEGWRGWSDGALMSAHAMM